jgi:hypothetical protein
LRYVEPKKELSGSFSLRAYRRDIQAIQETKLRVNVFFAVVEKDWTEQAACGLDSSPAVMNFWKPGDLVKATMRANDIRVLFDEEQIQVLPAIEYPAVQSNGEAVTLRNG